MYRETSSSKSGLATRVVFLLVISIEEAFALLELEYNTFFAPTLTRTSR